MADDATSPLLGASGPSSTSRPTPSQRSHRSEESTPLLSDSNTTPRYDGEEEEESDTNPSPAAASLRSLQDDRISPAPSKGGARWPTIVAVSALGAFVMVIMASVFFAPAIVEEYAKQSLVIEPTSLSIESFTPAGVKARIQADFRLDASRVRNDVVRSFGRAGTWIAHEVESKESKVEVYLPEFDNLLVGTAIVPPVVVNIRNGQTTHVNFSAELQPGDITGIRGVVNDWLDGRLGQLRVQGRADVSLKSGIFPLGTQRITESLVFQGNDIPSMPQYNITRLNFREIQIPSSGRGMAADVSLSVTNDYPISLEIPALGFDILVPNCALNEPYILLADAITDGVVVQPYSDVKVDVGGIVRQLPDILTTTCPNSDSSPLDLLLGGYIHGQDTTIFVRGSNAPAGDTPEWITKMLSSVTIPVPFPGHTFDNLVKNFSLTDVHFGLPDPFAEPGTPESNPSISGNIEVLAGLPKEMNFGVNVSRVRADADVFYKSKKLGVLELKKWQAANSTKTTDGIPCIKIVSQISDAPLNITDEDVFDDVVQALFFGGQPVILKIKALVDVEVGTVLGEFIIRDVPGRQCARKTSVTVLIISSITPKADLGSTALSKGGLSNLNPHVGDIKILDTSKTSLSFQVKVNFTNPTEYTAQIPYINIHLLKNGSIIGQGTVIDFNVSKGNNTNVLVNAVWDPYTLGGTKAKIIGRELLSQYISGWNTTLTFRTHEGSIPSQPSLGTALSKFQIEIPTPRLSTPSNGDDDGDDDDSENTGPHFIRDATFHLFSSTATFTLASPFHETDMYIETLNATALYNHTEPVGKILYDLPFKVPPGTSQTPKLPVEWSLDSVGYEKLREALGGELKLDAQGTVGIRLGQWREEVWYIGGGIGARVTI